MEHDILERLTKVTDHSGHVVRYSYDVVENRPEIAYPDGSVINYSYDKNNHLTGVTD